MKLGLKTLALALAVVLLCVPAALAKGGNGNASGHGKPSWAGGGNSGGNGHGKPAWAGQGHEKKAKPEKASGHEKKTKKDKQNKHQAGEDAEEEADGEELNLEDFNPAWYCKTLEAMMNEADDEAAEDGAAPGEFSSFDAEFGENDNKRNSFGKCVSRRAAGDDLTGALDGEAGSDEGDDSAGENEDEGEESEDQAADEEDGEDEDGELAAFARAIVSFIRL